MSDPSSDTSSVGFPPPLLYAGGFVAGVGAHRLLPVRVWPEPPAITSLLGWGLLVVGGLLVASAAYLFRRAGTTPNPTRPTSALVIWGPYRPAEQVRGAGDQEHSHDEEAPAEEARD